MSGIPGSFPITGSTLHWLEVIFAERYGHSWHLIRTDTSLHLQLDQAEGAIIFDSLVSGFTQAHSNQPFTQWDAQYEGWVSVLGSPLPAPGVTTLPSPLIEFHGPNTHIHYDIPGLTYWMLARVEEIGRTDLDDHERFPATSSHAYRHGYLDRPVVDEWLHILGQVIQRQWTGITLKQHQFQVRVSHDVDRPSLYAFQPWKSIARMMVGHLLKRHDLQAFFTAPYVKHFTRTKLLTADPYNTFDWLMDVSESQGLKSAFFFICGRTDPTRDSDYEPDHPVIRHLMRRIHARGHEIGLHPSYGTFRRPELIVQEAERLKQICAEEGIQQPIWGGRMHYLRWEQPTTLRAWANAGMDYDSTLGYADHPGFRCGTCFAYPMFDPVCGQPLPLYQYPLIVMECSIIDACYMKLGYSHESMDLMQSYYETCRRVGGSYAILWHNSYFRSSNAHDLYRELLSLSPCNTLFKRHDLSQSSKITS